MSTCSFVTDHGPAVQLGTTNCPCHSLGGTPTAHDTFRSHGVLSGVSCYSTWPSRTPSTTSDPVDGDESHPCQKHSVPRLPRLPITVLLWAPLALLGGRPNTPKFRGPHGEKQKLRLT